VKECSCYEKLADKRNVEDSKTIRARVQAAVQQLHLSARAYHRVLKLARTIADLAGSEMIAANRVFSGFLPYWLFLAN
jgi:predicted ATPase with chaperone activity